MENNSYFDLENAGFQSLLDEVQAEVHSLSAAERQSALRMIFSCIDNTTLNGSDTPASVAAFCRSTRSALLAVPSDGIGGDPVAVASVCVYPPFVALAKSELAGSGIGVASVAGGFPSGQTSPQVKNEEVRYVVGEGADEVDFVINRGRFLSGDESYVFDEIASAKAICGGAARLKVIVETGELLSAANIHRAALLALEAGADFVKTSTGKIPAGATPEAAFAMLSAVSEFEKKSGKKAGFKAAGGVSTPDDALLYYLMSKRIMHSQVINNKNFRIGTSRLVPQLQKILTF